MILLCDYYVIIMLLLCDYYVSPIPQLNSHRTRTVHGTRRNVSLTTGVCTVKYRYSAKIIWSIGRIAVLLPPR